MRVFIIEDEELSIERLQRQLSYFPFVEIMGVADSVKSAVEWLTLNDSPDLILMDIELGDGQCFNIFRKVDIDSGVIFVTSFDESSMRVFKDKGIDYLLKPVKLNDLEKCISSYADRLESGTIILPDIPGLLKELKKQHQPKSIRERLLVRNGHGLKAVECNEIAYLFADGKHFYLKTWAKETYAIDHSLDEVERMLNPELFHRLNKLFLVNEKSVSQVHKVNNYWKVQLTPSYDKEIIVNLDMIPSFIKKR